MGKWQHVFKEELEPTDRMNVPPVSLKLKEGFINPTFCSKPFDTPSMYEKEIKQALDAGHIAHSPMWSGAVGVVVEGDPLDQGGRHFLQNCCGFYEVE